jgi:hypothetical protein
MAVAGIETSFEAHPQMIDVVASSARPGARSRSLRISAPISCVRAANYIIRDYRRQAFRGQVELARAILCTASDSYGARGTQGRICRLFVTWGCKATT